MMLLRLFPLVMVVQAFCLYHAYSNGNDRKWYFIILFFPFIGSLFYLYDQFYSKDKIWEMQESIKGLIDEDYEVDKLLKNAKYTDTMANKAKLGEELFKREKFAQAAALFESCLVGFNQNNFAVIANLMKTNYQLEAYEKVITFGERIQEQPRFKKGDERIVYAWSLHKTGRTSEARDHFSAFDLPFSNYPHRMEYATFLKDIVNVDDSADLLNRMKDEIEHMEPREKKMKANILSQIKKMQAE